VIVSASEARHVRLSAEGRVLIPGPPLCFHDPRTSYTVSLY
jgi:hypothetical protein